MREGDREVIFDSEYLDYVIRVQKYFERFGDADRIIKVQEEAGEVAEAYLRWTQKNLWKTQVPASEIAHELADVVLTALVAMVHFGFDPNDMLTQQQSKTEERIRDFPA